MSDKLRQLRTMDDVSLDGKTVLVRVDFNVNLGDDGQVGETEDYRIKAAQTTIEELQQRRCKIVLLTHLGRPQEDGENADLTPVCRRLADLVREEIKLLPQLGGDTVKTIISGMERGELAMLPNVRLDEREETGSDKLAQELADLAEIYINEAFSVCHRDHTSVTRVPRLLTSCAGRRTVAENKVMSELVDNPKHPYVAIVGGAKIDTKLGFFEELLNKVDYLCVGGVLANMFLTNQGKAVLGSFSYQEMQLAKMIWEQSADKIVLPQDVVIGTISGKGVGREVVSIDTALSSSVKVWDVGPETIKDYLSHCKQAATIMWNGPVGKFEDSDYVQGTKQLAEGLAELPAYKVVGGGDTATALGQFKLMEQYDHVSVGGGAMIAFLEGSKLPGLEVLKGTD